MIFLRHSISHDSVFSHLYRIAEFRLVKLCNWQRCLTFKSTYYQKAQGVLWAWVRKVLWRKMSERSKAESVLSGKSHFTVYDKCATRCTAIVWWRWKHIFSFQRWEQWSVPHHGEVWGKLFEELQYVPPRSRVTEKWWLEAVSEVTDKAETERISRWRGRRGEQNPASPSPHHIQTLLECSHKPYLCVCMKPLQAILVYYKWSLIFLVLLLWIFGQLEKLWHHLQQVFKSEGAMSMSRKMIIKPLCLTLNLKVCTPELLIIIPHCTGKLRLCSEQRINHTNHVVQLHSIAPSA